MGWGRGGWAVSRPPAQGSSCSAVAYRSSAAAISSPVSVMKLESHLPSWHVRLLNQEIHTLTRPAEEVPCHLRLEYQ